MKILLVEDDAETASYVAKGLAEEGHAVTTCADGRDGLLRATAEDWELLIVDRMLPALDGLALVRTLRASGMQTPAIFLTTMAGVGDRVAGLNAGADDYLVKPFAYAELSARVAALGRRPRTLARDTVLRIGDLELDQLARTVKRQGVAIELQPREFRLLEYLMKNAGQTVTRTMLLQNVWGFQFDPHTNIVESHISRLRAKIQRKEAAELIHTVRGAGYCMHAPA